MKMLDKQAAGDSDKLNLISNFRDKIHFHDLIMLTDIYSIPQLLTLLSQSQLSESNIEYRILKQIAHSEDTLLKRKQKGRAETSAIIPYNGATVAFVISTLAAFGLKAIKFEKSATGMKVCKIKIDGLNITEAEIQTIVHKIELVFHLAQHNESYRQGNIWEIQKTLSLPDQEPTRLNCNRELVLL